jgi:hypothetical protein
MCPVRNHSVVLVDIKVHLPFNGGERIELVQVQPVRLHDSPKRFDHRIRILDIDQFDDRGIDVPNLVDCVGADADGRFAGTDASAWSPPEHFRHWRRHVVSNDDRKPVEDERSRSLNESLAKRMKLRTTC